MDTHSTDAGSCLMSMQITTSSFMQFDVQSDFQTDFQTDVKTDMIADVRSTRYLARRSGGVPGVGGVEVRKGGKGRKARVFDADRAVRAHLAAADLRAPSDAPAASLSGSTYRVVLDATAGGEGHGLVAGLGADLEAVALDVGDLDVGDLRVEDLAVEYGAGLDKELDTKDGAVAHAKVAHAKVAHAGPVHASAVHASAVHMCAVHAGNMRASPRPYVMLDAFEMHGDARAPRRSCALACGAVHELRGVSLCMDRGADPAAGVPVDGAGFAPFGCILHILRCMAAATPSNAACRELLEAGVVWIGDKVHPSPEGLACALQCEIPAPCDGAGQAVDAGQAGDAAALHDLVDHFVFVRDAAEGVRACPHDPVPQRVWCAEQAIRMGAAGVVIVDGTGFDTLAWRRLQLAAAGGAASLHSMHAEPCTASGIDVASQLRADEQRLVAACSGASDEAMRPLVLVITPPPEVHGGASRIAGRRASRGGGASTRWSVCPLHMPDPNGHFAWRMRLDAVKSADAIPCDDRSSANRSSADVSCADIRGGASLSTRGRMEPSRGDVESGHVFVDIVMPRAMHGDREWAALQALVRGSAALQLPANDDARGLDSGFVPSRSGMFLGESLQEDLREGGAWRPWHARSA